MRTGTVPMPLWAKVAVAVVLGAPLAAWVLERHERVSLQNRLAPIASDIAGRQVGVRCPGRLGRLMAPADTLAGRVPVDAAGRVGDHTELRAATCAELGALAGGARREQLACAERSPGCGEDVKALAWAINTLAHEAIHLRGILDEALTECYGMQHLAFAAERLGATPAQARGLALLHWETSDERKPGQYRVSGECRDGGRLDLRPDDPAWP